MATKHKIQVSCERTFQGAWKLSALVGGQLHTKQYLYYTKAEALVMFRSFLKSLV